MQPYKKQTGLTLLEIIISVAIIGILGLGFLSFFSKGFIWVVDAGQRSQALFNSQQSIESVIGQGSGSSTVSYDFSFDFGSNEFIVPGKIESFDGTSGNQQVDLQVFIPSLTSGGGSGTGTTDEDIIQAALDTLTTLQVTDADHNNTDVPKPTIQVPSNINGVVFSFDSCNIVGPPGVNITSGVVTRHATDLLTARLVLKGTLNSSSLTKNFTVNIPRHKNNPANVTANQE